MLRALLTSPFFLSYIAGPLALLGALCVWMHVRLGRGPGIPSRATNHALAASWLSLLGLTVYFLQQIVLSERGTAVFSLIMIAPSGLTLAAIVFPIAWALSVIVQSIFVHRRRQPGETWSLPLASAIVLVASLIGVAGAYSDHLARRARTETSPDVLRTLHARRWTQRDARVLVALAENEHTPPDVLAALVAHPDVRADVARNPATAPELLERLYLLPDHRADLAVNPSAPPSLLRKLAGDSGDHVRSNLLWNPNLPADVLETLARDPAIGPSAIESVRRSFGSRWYLMAPPYTWRWRRPFTRVLDDDAPPEAWHRTEGFDTRDACEALRAEFVRRESNPKWRYAPQREGDQPRDFYMHTRCAFVQSGTAPRPTS